MKNASDIAAICLLGAVALGGLFAWVASPRDPREAEAKLAQQRASRECRERADIEAAKYLRAFPAVKDDFCRQALESFVRNAKAASCSRFGGADLPIACASLKKLRRYCPPTTWPADATDPATLHACQM